MNSKVNRLFNASIVSCCTLTISVAIAQERLRDPTRPADYQEEAASQDRNLLDTTGNIWKLDSTLIAGDRKLAVINGVLVAKGDKRGNMEVVDIKPSMALLRVNNQNVELRLVGSNVKNRANNKQKK